MVTDALVRDLIARTERAVESVTQLANETNITFKVGDVVDAVERGLPSDYAVQAGQGRREIVAGMAEEILSGEMYEES